MEDYIGRRLRRGKFSAVVANDINRSLAKKKPRQIGRALELARQTSREEGRCLPLCKSIMREEEEHDQFVRLIWALIDGFTSGKTAY